MSHCIFSSVVKRASVVGSEVFGLLCYTNIARSLEKPQDHRPLIEVL